MSDGTKEGSGSSEEQNPWGSYPDTDEMTMDALDKVLRKAVREKRQKELGIGGLSDFEEASVSIQLTGDEAIVFHSLLVRLNADNKGPIRHLAEQRVLWDLECMLEEHLVALLRKDYPEILERALTRLQDSNDGL